MHSYNSYSCEKEITSDNVEYYTVSSHFHRLTKEQCKDAIIEMRRLKNLFDAENRIQECK